MKEKLTNAILKVAEVLQMNKYLTAIRNGCEFPYKSRVMAT